MTLVDTYSSRGVITCTHHLLTFLHCSLHGRVSVYSNGNCTLKCLYFQLCYLYYLWANLIPHAGCLELSATRIIKQAQRRLIDALWSLPCVWMWIPILCCIPNDWRKPKLWRQEAQGEDNIDTSDRLQELWGHPGITLLSESAAYGDDSHLQDSHSGLTTVHVLNFVHMKCAENLNASVGWTYSILISKLRFEQL